MSLMADGGHEDQYTNIHVLTPNEVKDYKKGNWFN